MAPKHALALWVDKSNYLKAHLGCTVCGWQGKKELPAYPEPNSKKFQIAKREYDVHVKAAEL
jgi:hypothetical protein